MPQFCYELICYANSKLDLQLVPLGGHVGLASRQDKWVKILNREIRIKTDNELVALKAKTYLKLPTRFI